MSKKSSPTLIGGFVIGAVALLASAVVLFGGSELLAKRVYYVAYFEEQTKGLRVGSNVILNGVRVGFVSEIALLIDESEFETMTRVTLEILPDTCKIHGEKLIHGENFINNQNFRFNVCRDRKCKAHVHST